MSKPCFIPSTPHEAESEAGAGSSQSSHGVGGQVGEANDGDNIPHTRNGVLSTGSSAVGTDMATQTSSSGLVRDVIGIFVVAFDTKEGNLLEWCVPKELPLEGVEFRALISGAHTITSDFIYFRQGDYFGAACYEKLTVLSEIERGARMKSVGVIVANYDTLHHHLEYLAQQVSNMLHNPGDYSALEEYYQKRQAMIPSSWDTPQKYTSPPVLINKTVLRADGHGEGFEKLLQLYGEQLLVLWRATLLCKRILLFSPPPIGMLCSRVHCISLLGSHTTPGLPSQLLRPLYYVNIADVETLQEQHAYIACTTEKIFEEKTGLLDIYVDNQNIRIPGSIRHLLTITTQDRKRLAQLQCIARSSRSSVQEFINYFSQSNNKIFSTLHMISQSDDNILKRHHIETMGLHPQHDRGFVSELALTHGFDITTSKNSWKCCPCDN
ncbi:DENN domain-containing protein 11-like [Penaeus chinensis]|uniref:DENN domain-containing protein 11-like n=1 Tax=Penaeus chinensis TaxID=139456 RepID=UPI001FB7372F|nr:DENN domain-containing protein 11-like [Penaeus chinensis]